MSADPRTLPGVALIAPPSAQQFIAEQADHAEAIELRNRFDALCRALAPSAPAAVKAQAATRIPALADDLRRLGRRLCRGRLCLVSTPAADTAARQD